MIDAGQKLLDSLAETWDFFFCDVLSMLQAIFHPVQVHDLPKIQLVFFFFIAVFAVQRIISMSFLCAGQGALCPTASSASLQKHHSPECEVRGRPVSTSGPCAPLSHTDAAYSTGRPAGTEVNFTAPCLCRRLVIFCS